jgi:hypothetical protein
MDKIDLSPEARRCLWQCYSLLLRLADEAENNTDGSRLDVNNKPDSAPQACKKACLGNKSTEESPIQTEIEKQESECT